MWHFYLKLKWLNTSYASFCYLSKRNSFEPLMAELSPFESYTIYKNVKKIQQKYVNFATSL